MKAIGLDNAEVCMLFSCYDKSSLAMFYYEHSYSIKSLSVFTFNGNAFIEFQMGHDDTSDKFQQHVAKFSAVKGGKGQNTDRPSRRCLETCQKMPFLYVWLLLVAGAITAVDHYFYHYKYWFVQGVAMGFIVLIAFLFFGCGAKKSANGKSNANVIAETAGKKDIENDFGLSQY